MIRYKMFEKEITEGNHVSYHFCVDKFGNNFHPKSKHSIVEKSLSYIDIDLSKYECNITTSNTTSFGDYFHISYLKRRPDQFLSEEVLKYFNISTKFPVLYFTRKLPFEDNYKCGFYLNVYKTFKSKFFKDTIKTLKHFSGLYHDVFFAGDFDINGNFIDKSINIEIFPLQTKDNFYKIKNILLNNFDVVESKLNLYDNKFSNYTEDNFFFHIKIKLSDQKPIVKFYRTYPHNPYITYYDYKR